MALNTVLLYFKYEYRKSTGNVYTALTGLCLFICKMSPYLRFQGTAFFHSRSTENVNKYYIGP